MSFDKHGFLSPEISRFRASLRDVPTYKSWLEYAAGLNQFALEILDGHEPLRTDNQRLMISVLFIRAHKSFQAAIILAEDGLVGDARTVIRRATEGAIALHALANDATFVTQLMDAHYLWQRKTANLILNNPDYTSVYEAAQIAQLQATVNQVGDMESARGSKLKDIIWANVAAKHCPSLYDTLYRLHSTDGTHTNVTAIHREVEFDYAGQISGIKVGPDTEGMVETVKSACMALLWALDPFTRAYSIDQKRVGEELNRFKNLPQNEPADVQVTANFRQSA